ncbi:MAG: D-alanyl-D-alanine carboxypeptidase/D-alanyl-D-alanine-endopeptidase [Nevskia sp.]|nr:D-alanyl-D-alanine carboxypeptidase/D-alanyl-D-alanine-endopeptidase [Nevskia sp.]
MPFLCGSLLLCFGPLAHAADWQALRALERSGAVVTAEAVDLDSGAVLEQVNAAERLTPASLTKLVVAADTLDVWAADKTFQTRLVGAGPFKDGTINGDLMLLGGGDSTFDHLSLWSLAEQVRGRGVSAINGRLVVDTAPFGPLGCETKDRCDALARSDTAYNAPLSAVAVDYGNWCVDIRPTGLGSPAVVSTCGTAQAPIPVEGSIKTVSSTAQPTFWVERVTLPTGEVLRVGGDVPQGGTVSVYRSMSDPALGTGLMLREVLREIGIPVSGTVDVVHTAPPIDAYPLAQNDGLSLKEQLGRMLRFSNNYVADMLTLNVAAVQRAQAPAQLADAARSLSDYVLRIKTDNKTGKPSAPPLFSGSGLTPENLLSAEDLTTVLAAQYRNTRDFPAFYGGLVVPRQAPFKFLRVGSPAWLDRVALKTGTMDDPHSVCGIAGYLRKQNGGWIAFAAIVNGGQRMKHVPLYMAMEAARGDVDSLLARY